MTILHMDDRRDCVLLGPLGVREKPNFSVVVTDIVVTKTSGSLLQEVSAAQESPLFFARTHSQRVSLVLTIRAVLK